MENLLIVSSSEKSAKSLGDLIHTVYPCSIIHAANGDNARRQIAQKDFDLMIINTPLSDEVGMDLALTVTTKTTTGVILLIKPELSPNVCAKVENYGVMVVEKPINRATLFQAIRLLNVARNRLLGYKKETVKLENQIAEMRLVDRAKGALIKCLNMNEEQAHKYILKHAMDMRMTKAEVAQNILKTYEY